MESANTTSIIILVLFILLSYTFYCHHYQGLEPFQTIPFEGIESDIEYSLLEQGIHIPSLNKNVPIEIANVPLLNTHYDNLNEKYNSLFSKYYDSKVDDNPKFISNINDSEIKLENINNKQIYQLKVKDSPLSDNKKCLTNTKNNKYSLEPCNINDSKQYLKIKHINNDKEYLEQLDKGTIEELEYLKSKNELNYPFHLIKDKRANNCLTNYNVNPCGEVNTKLKIESCVPENSKKHQWLLDGVD